MQTDKILIAIVDDHTLFRDGVAVLMAEFDELQVVFEAENGEQMQHMLARHPLPQVILMDINMPVMDGYLATKWVKDNHPQIKVLALSMFEEDKAVIRMIKSGAGGYVLKESKPRELLHAIKTINEKGVYINEMVSGKLVRKVADDDGPDFSRKEFEFLRLCCSELTYKEIADLMFVSPRTVDNYRESLFQKLNLKTRTGLVLYAIQNEIFKF
ncbi:response regulator transcription factor [Mucilaginibacter flavidus]|uniref:response regulator transcription factor n=1 Tax=Mucilaginibacter flavidus TaxID=2949309 RepID=UPI0020920FD8|nr:response regulator transcription factor [Mucilaginibacter flavidus]MCO5950027.1 response regulator transcription factor [Mucilaginibacter flavidus]